LTQTAKTSAELPKSQSKILLFGGTGAIGTAIHDYFLQRHWDVIVVTRNEVTHDKQVSWNPLISNADVTQASLKELGRLGPFDAVCWAQGANCTDSIYKFNIEQHKNIYDANVLFILNSLHSLLTNLLLSKPARLCVVSSIWQKMARQDKMSYCITKAALEGLVLSAATDLAREGHIINAVLPGVIDTPMAHTNLSAEQIRKVESGTLFNRLPTLHEVAACVHNLCQPDNTAVTGQFIAVDLGYSNVRII
jgi:3-oxoacyl-[acyl-carrier protein] reductase